jgi:hypothetical protein
MNKKRVLRYGYSGPDVTELQNKLNLKPPTALPPLTPDGIFGQKTHARVMEFQRNNELVADGIVGPNTWGAIDSPSPAKPNLPSKPPPVPPTPGSVAKKIILSAKAQIGSIDYGIRKGPSMEPHGWQHLGTILEKGANKKFPDHQLKATPNPGGLSWCGIFCVYCYQLAHKAVIWQLGIGPRGQVKKVNQWDMSSHAEFEAHIQPGDIGVIAARSHHFIIVSTDPGSGTIESIDGNMARGQIMKLKTRKLSQVVAFYTPV